MQSRRSRKALPGQISDRSDGEGARPKEENSSQAGHYHHIIRGPSLSLVGRRGLTQRVRVSLCSVLALSILAPAIAPCLTSPICPHATRFQRIPPEGYRGIEVFLSERLSTSKCITIGHSKAWVHAAGRWNKRYSHRRRACCDTCVTWEQRPRSWTCGLIDCSQCQPPAGERVHV